MNRRSASGMQPPLQQIEILLARRKGFLDRSEPTAVQGSNNLAGVGRSRRREQYRFVREDGNREEVAQSARCIRMKTVVAEIAQSGLLHRGSDLRLGQEVDQVAKLDFDLGKQGAHRRNVALSKDAARPNLYELDPSGQSASLR